MFIFNVFFWLMCLDLEKLVFIFLKKIKKVKLYGKDGVYFLKKMIKKS